MWWPACFYRPWACTSTWSVSYTHLHSAGPYITHTTRGRIVDLGVTDAANMGAAMAPAAHDTLTALFRDTATTPRDYDLIVTGDLGYLGHALLTELFRRDGVELGRCV